jgi:hypothetical protein
MPFLLNFFQLFGWVGLGYFIAKNNLWACITCVMFSITIGLTAAMNDVGKELKRRGNSN